ncbi:hypothetical protein ACE41H_17820 [Paenibacillus enshidis]|uniref:ECF transporter S component n=1 Tax=Paenibacillus enshidis TaxID=1458439 RepID=A0ABV5AWP3_9BACL
MKLIGRIVVGMVFGATASIVVSFVVNLLGGMVGYTSLKFFSAIIPAAITFAVIGAIITKKHFSNVSLWITSVIIAWICVFLINTVGTVIRSYLDFGSWITDPQFLIPYALLMATIMLPVTGPLTRYSIYLLKRLLHQLKIA